MANLTTQTISSSAGTVLTKANCASGGDSFANDGHTFLSITNAHATDSRTVTIDAKASANVPGLGNITLADTVVTVAAQTTKLIGPFPRGRFNNDQGKVALTYSNSAADLTIAVVSLKQEQDG